MDRHEHSWFVIAWDKYLRYYVIMRIVPIDLKYTVIFIRYTCTDKYMCIQGILNLLLLYNDQIRGGGADNVYSISPQSFGLHTDCSVDKSVTQASISGIET